MKKKKKYIYIFVFYECMYFYPEACFHLLSTLIHTFRILEGLSDDDLQESAYEILLSSLVFSG